MTRADVASPALIFAPGALHLFRRLDRDPPIVSIDLGFLLPAPLADLYIVGTGRL
jgi:hypothetical protein